MAELNIFGAIGEWPNTPAFLADWLAANPGDITININSAGGDYVAGMGMMQMLDGKGATTVNMGVCASAATLIFMAGKERIAPKGTLFGIHYAWTPAGGNADQLDKSAEDLRKIDDQMVQVYMAACTKDEKALRSAMKQETLLSADECADWGFATQVKELAIAANMAAAFGRVCAMDATRRQNERNKTMETQKMESDLAAANAKVAELEAALNAAIEDAKSAKAKAEEQANTIKALMDAQADEFASAAVEAGRIKAEQKDAWKAAFLSDSERAKAMLPDVPKAAKPGNPPLKIAGAGSSNAEEVRAQFNAMSPGPERSAFFAKNRQLIVG